MHTTPPTLFEKLRQGNDPDAWNRFVKLYTPLLYHWARRLTPSAADADDLVHDVIVKLLKVLRNFDYDPAKGKFRGWLQTTCRNVWRDFKRKLGNQMRQAGAGELAALQTVADSDDFWNQEDHRLRAILVREALRNLDDLCGDFGPATIAAFRETVLNKRPVNEVAQELGQTPNAVYLANLRVRTRLQKELAHFSE